MEFKDKLVRIGATVEDIEKLGYSIRTAYYWFSGERVPKKFTQQVVIEAITTEKSCHEAVKDIRSRIGGN